MSKYLKFEDLNVGDVVQVVEAPVAQDIGDIVLVGKATSLGNTSGLITLVATNPDDKFECWGSNLDEVRFQLLGQLHSFEVSTSTTFKV